MNITSYVTNKSSMIVQNNLTKSTNALNQAIERMTTGFKLNHSSDNAAGYSIAQNMSSQITSYQVAEENAMMGMDMLQTAMDSADLIASHLQRIRALTEQGANGTYGQQSLEAINSEIQARVSEINRIIKNTEYNGIQLFNVTSNVSGSSGASGASGAGGAGGVSGAGGASGAGSASGVLYVLNNMGVSTADTHLFINPVERLTEEEAVAQGYTVIKTKDDLENIKNNMSGKYILMNDIDLNNSCLSYSTDNSYVFRGELNGNGHVIKNFEHLSSDGLIYLGLFSSGNEATIKNLGLEDVNLSSPNHISGGIFATSRNSEISNVYVTGTIHGKYDAEGIVAEGSNNIITDSYVDATVDGNYGTGAIGNATCTNVYWNTDKTTNPDSVSSTLSGATGVTTEELAALLMNNNGISPHSSGGASTVKMQVGIGGDENSCIDVSLGLGLSNLSLSISSSTEARNLLSTIDGYLDTISAKQTEYGAAYNRLESAIDSIGVSIDNLTSSLSTIRDADIAKESSQYIKNQILQQAAATLLATANQSPSIALQLI